MSSRLAAVLAGVCLLGVLGGTACKEEINRPPVGTDPSTVQPDRPAGGGISNEGGTTPVDPDAGTVTGACNDILANGPLVDEVNVSGSAPAGTGGTIADGTYDLTEDRNYVGAAGAGPTGVQLRETLVVSGSELDFLTLSGGKETRQTYTFATSGAGISISKTCPTTAPTQQGQFSLVGSQLILLFGAEEMVYIKK
jgi:hypothetical protein